MYSGIESDVIKKFNKLFQDTQGIDVNLSVSLYTDILRTNLIGELSSL